MNVGLKKSEILFICMNYSIGVHTYTVPICTLLHAVSESQPTVFQDLFLLTVVACLLQSHSSVIALRYRECSCLSRPQCLSVVAPSFPYAIRSPHLWRRRLWQMNVPKHNQWGKKDKYHQNL